MKIVKLPLKKIDVEAARILIKSVAESLSRLKDLKSLKFTVQQITENDEIRTYTAEFLSSGAHTISEFVIPHCKKAIDYKPFMLELLKKGCTQKRISEILDVSPSTISRIINGK